MNSLLQWLPLRKKVPRKMPEKDEFFAAVDDRLLLLQSYIPVKAIDKILQYFEDNLSKDSEDYPEKIALLRQAYEAMATATGKSFEEILEMRSIFLEEVSDD